MFTAGTCLPSRCLTMCIQVTISVTTAHTKFFICSLVVASYRLLTTEITHSQTRTATANRQLTSTTCQFRPPTDWLLVQSSKFLWALLVCPWYRPHRKHRVLYCYVSTRFRGNVITGSLPSNGGIYSFRCSSFETSRHSISVVRQRFVGGLLAATFPD
jgi:hypothetical protein